MAIVTENSKYNLQKTNTQGDRAVEVKHLTELIDTPDEYTGEAGYIAIVNSAEDGIEYTHPDNIGFPSGTTQLFIQNHTPPGWTLSTTHNDRVIRTTTTVGNGGSTGGTWSLTGITTGGHTLTINEIPDHDHKWPGVTYTSGYTAAVPGFADTGSIDNQTGAAQPHSHPLSSDNSWRPSYIDAIVAIKD